MKSSLSKNKKPTKPATDRTTKDLVEIFKSLADEKRLQILRLLLKNGKMNVTAICEELDEKSQPAVSHHLFLLKHARLVDFERDGKFNHYYISSDAVKAILDVLFPNSHRAQQNFTFGDLEIVFKTK